MLKRHFIGKAVLLLSALALTFTVIGPTVASAADSAPVPLILRPSDVKGNPVQGPGYFVFDAKAGSTTSLYAFVGDLGKTGAPVKLVPVDATSAATGGISYNLPQQPRKAVGAWIALGITKAKLDPNKGMVVPFTVHVPAKTKPGQYVGALTAYVPAPKAHRHGAIAIQLQTRVVDALVVTVPGPQYARFAIGRIYAVRAPTSMYYVTIGIRNTGNVMLKGQGWLWVSQPGTKGTVLQTKLNIDTTIPHTVAKYPVGWSAHPQPGRYRADVLVWWGSQKVTAHHWFWVGPHTTASSGS
jgi:hypothetical protein